MPAEVFDGHHHGSLASSYGTIRTTQLLMAPVVVREFHAVYQFSLSEVMLREMMYTVHCTVYNTL